MQLYTPGLTHLFWRQVASLPEGLHNRESNQAPAVATTHLFATFVDRPIGTILEIFMNGAKVADVKVVDLTGFVYASLFVPHSHGQDSIAIEVRETGGLLVESSVFATSDIDFTFEVKSDFEAPNEVDAEQLSQDVSIAGVEQAMLGDKFGAFTGLTRRNDQTIEQYRAQTACLWRAFQFASMEEGLVESLRCVLGDVLITLEPTRQVVGNRVFVHPQYEPASGDEYTAGGGWSPALRRSLDDLPNHYASADTPHYYVPDIPVDFYSAYPSGGGLAILLAGGTDNTPDGWIAAHAQTFTIRSEQAIGNEVFALVQESDAIRLVSSEQVLRRTGTTEDYVANTNIASIITISAATTPSTLLPVESVDFTVDPFTGKITWLGTLQQPVDGTIYTLGYAFRLDDAIRIVVRQVKPVQRSVVILFQNQTSSLPKAIEI